MRYYSQIIFIQVVVDTEADLDSLITEWEATTLQVSPPSLIKPPQQKPITTTTTTTNFTITTTTSSTATTTNPGGPDNNRYNKARSYFRHFWLRTGQRLFPHIRQRGFVLRILFWSKKQCFYSTFLIRWASKKAKRSLGRCCRQVLLGTQS